MAQPTDISPLLSLPGEIRNTIYELVLISPKTIKICSTRKKISPTSLFLALPPAHNFAHLLQVNKQIYEEASPIYYSGNQFSMGLGGGRYGYTTEFNMNGLKEFVKRIPAYQLAQISTVSVEILYARDSSLANIKLEREELLNSKDLCSIGEIFGKHFTGLETLFFKHHHKRMGVRKVVLPPLQEKIDKELRMMAEALLGLERLKTIVSSEDGVLDIMRAMKYVTDLTGRKRKEGRNSDSRVVMLL